MSDESERGDEGKRALMLLNAPEINTEVVALVRRLGDEGRKTLQAAAAGKRQELTQKQRAHAVELLALVGEIEDTDLQKLAAEEAASVRRHALLALQDRGRADLLAGALGQKALDDADHAIVLQALAGVGGEEQVKETLAWAQKSENIELRDLAAAAIRSMRRRKSAVDVDNIDLLGKQFEDFRP
jgi:hypothetical protein